MLSAVLLSTGCSRAATWLLGVPPSGIYASAAGDRFDIETLGPTAMSVRAEQGGLCLQFWEVSGSAKPRQQAGVVRLEGQECADRTFGHLPWRASYAKARRSVVELIPPRPITDGPDGVVRLSYLDAG